MRKVRISQQESIRNQTAMLLNALLSADYQLSNLSQPGFDEETRLMYAHKFVKAAIEITTKIRESL